MKGKHANSIESYNQALASGMIETDSQKIFELLTYEPPITQRQISARLGWPIYKVRRRVSEMIANGILIECGKIKSAETGCPERVVRIATDSERKAMEQDKRMENLLEDAAMEYLKGCLVSEIIDKLEQDLICLPLDIEDIILALMRMGYIRSLKND